MEFIWILVATCLVACSSTSLVYNDTVTDVYDAVNSDYPFWPFTPTIYSEEQEKIGLERWIQHNDNLPEVCRTDICYSQSTTNRKGTFNWSRSYAGDNVTVTCPHGGLVSSERPAISHRTCEYTSSYGENYFAYWGAPITADCQWESTITQELFHIMKQLDNIDNNSSSVVHLMMNVQQLTSNPDNLTEIDVDIISDIIEVVVRQMFILSVRDMHMVGGTLVDVVSQLTEVDIDVLSRVTTACGSITDNLELYMENIEFDYQSSIKYKSENIDVDVRRMRDTFEGGSDTVSGSDIGSSGYFAWSSEDDSSRSTHGVLLTIPLDPLWASDTDGMEDSSFVRSQRSIGMPLMPSDRLVLIVYYDNSLFSVRNDLPGPNNTPSSSLEVSSTVAFSSAMVLGQMVTQLSEPVRVTFRKDDIDGNQSSVLCGVDPGFDMMDDAMGCQEAFITGLYITCLCDILGSYYIMTQKAAPSTIISVDDERAGGFEFLGFPYIEVLSVFTFIGFGVSIISLVMTISTFAVFRQLRRGRPTIILMNLCVALCLQMTAFLVLIPVVDNQYGCRFANVLKVYLILVTLMWNGVEGLNMYLALIQVFTIHITHFVLKCGIIAWVVPIIIVVLPLLFDSALYDGFYSTETAPLCPFVCQLPRTTFFFVLLLPMSLIIIGNSIVFILVLRILRRKTQNGNQSSKFVQLRGAVAMLLLLGLAWIFSGFAVINYGSVGKDLQVIQITFQCLFVFCIAFQGFYIFIFHCARHQEVRATWLQCFCKRKSDDGSGSSLVKTKTSSGDQVIPNLKQTSDADCSALTSL
ncbi:adhesion G-protein coupled receptor G6-like [Saccoglossus kowalevskii]|uniref:Probable G-protein coupled receptor 112-like n=1 Tax=Saccoglossus kowalevskii TaxID=10224 RepID=A0ABM0LXH5_SACKO|nr:PREDICTED: probable G-protein coupled receptor 112-like [Saccoglossus kowalevskii]